MCLYGAASQVFEKYPLQLIAVTSLKPASLSSSSIPSASHPPVAGVAQASVQDTPKPSPLLDVPPVGKCQNDPIFASISRDPAASARPQATSRGVRPLPLQDAAATYGTMRSTRRAVCAVDLRGQGRPESIGGVRNIL